jgi:DNA polymerase-3 subunit alpha
VTGIENLEIFQGKGFTGALVKLPAGEYPGRLLPMLRLHHGNLPLFFEYRSKDGVIARVKAGPELGLRYDPDLGEKLAKEVGCGLTWTY